MLLNNKYKYFKPIMNDDVAELIYCICDNVEIYRLLIMAYLQEKLIFIQRKKEKTLLEMTKKTIYKPPKKIEYIYNKEISIYYRFDDIHYEEVRCMEEIIKESFEDYRLILYY